MNILFITLLDMRSIDAHDIYTDLMREFVKHGHDVYIASPTERRNGMPTELLEDTETELHKHAHILKIKTGNIQKTNIIEKGISTVLLEYQLMEAIKHYFSNVKFDLVLYSTPPITLIKPVEYIKKRDNAKSYLMLKDIFPQNAVDLGMMNTEGAKGFLYRYFRKKEKKLYNISDKIGCMSQANVDYVLEHNPEIEESKVEICPNIIEFRNVNLMVEQRTEMRSKYKLPLDKTIFVYGGNLGKPQGIPFIIDCLRTQSRNTAAYFLIVGSGTEYDKLHQFIAQESPSNVMLVPYLPRDEYDQMIAACDVGLIFLDHRFTIPNYPSRLLSYIQAGIPVLAATDKNTDIGKDIENNGIGWWCESNNVDAFCALVEKAASSRSEATSIDAFKHRLILSDEAKRITEIV